MSMIARNRKTRVATLALAMMLVCALSSVAYAQEPEPTVRSKGDLSFHLKVGGQYTNLRGPDPRIFLVVAPLGGEGSVEDPDALKFEANWNASASAAIEVHITETFSLQAELGYSRRTSNVVLDEETLAIDPDAALLIRGTYLQIPILARFYTNRSAKIRPYFYGGLALSVRLSAEAETPLLGAIDIEDLSDQLKSTDFGYAVGFGLDVGKHLEFEFRQYYGTKDIIAVDFDDKITWGAAVFTLGIRF